MDTDLVNFSLYWSTVSCWQILVHGLTFYVSHKTSQKVSKDIQLIFLPVLHFYVFFKWILNMLKRFIRCRFDELWPLLWGSSSLESCKRTDIDKKSHHFSITDFVRNVFNKQTDMSMVKSLHFVTWVPILCHCVFLDPFGMFSSRRQVEQTLQWRCNYCVDNFDWLNGSMLISHFTCQSCWAWAHQRS